MNDMNDVNNILYDKITCAWENLHGIHERGILSVFKKGE